MSSGRIASFFSLLVCLAALTPSSPGGEIVRLDGLEGYDLQVVGFELPRAADVRIEAAGVGIHYGGEFFRWFGRRDDDGDRMAIASWLIDSKTREPVWALTYRESDRTSGNRYLREADEVVELPAGRYELYQFSGIESVALPFRMDDDSRRGDRDHRDHRDDDDDESWVDRVFDNDDSRREDILEALDASFVSLSVDGMGSGDLRRFEVTGVLPRSVIRLAGMGDQAFAEAGLEVLTPGKIRIYSIYEQAGDDRTSADYGWIVDEATRRTVWSADDAWEHEAGGGRKNKRVDDEVELAAGRYLVYFGTDDSHSYERFNTAPPADPMNWGITILPGDGRDAATIATFQPQPQPEPLIELVQVGDDQDFERPFRMAADGALRILALGEYGSGDRFYDHGWIVEAGSGKVVWEMTRRNTVGAGGAEKNRRFDGTIDLARGDYILYYVTDDSHSFEAFNQAAPFTPDRWGITLRPAPETSPATFSELEEQELENADDVLVRLVRIRDHERVRRQFTVDRTTRVRVYAIGEGDRDEMYDYGYLVNDATGETIWEMSWRNTSPAGGADKNRLADEVLVIEPGTYEAVFVTDGSHSFGDWNASQPRDPINWGMTLRRVE